MPYVAKVIVCVCVFRIHDCLLDFSRGIYVTHTKPRKLFFHITNIRLFEVGANSFKFGNGIFSKFQQTAKKNRSTTIF